VKGKISEIFESTQGEGIYFGEKQLFIRFFGCNLSCNFCDTKLKDFKEYEASELFEKIKSFQGLYHSISFTGGEPLFQKEFLKEALTYTGKFGYKNYLETNGTLPLELSEVIGRLDIVAMDLKMPSSIGYDGELWDKHRDFLKIASRKEVFLKSVICEATNEDDLKEALTLIREVNRSAVLVLQPNSRQENQALAEKIERFKEIALTYNITTCVIPQLHKAIGIE